MSSPRRERTKFMKKHITRHSVTIDTSKAHSNADVVKMCVRELGLVEVCLFIIHVCIQRRYIMKIDETQVKIPEHSLHLKKIESKDEKVSRNN